MPSQFDKSQQHEIDFILARNAFMDAFAEVETLISRVLSSCGVAPSSEPFGHRLKAFRGAQKTNMIAKANLPQRDHIADTLGAILPVRADIVHSKMRIANLDGQTVALFVNAQEAISPYPCARFIPLPAIRALTRELHDLSKKIDNLNKTKLNPASSPPPPSPDATADP